jgi:hypothetical protein
VAALDEGEGALALPTPLSPRSITPTPLMSRVVACSVVEGANSLSMHRVARFTKFIVIIGVRKIGRWRSSATASIGWVGVVIAREHEARDAARTAMPFKISICWRWRERLQVGHLGGAEHLDAFVREILEETGERERRAVDRALADEPVQAGLAGHELQLQLGSR